MGLDSLKISSLLKEVYKQDVCYYSNYDTASYTVRFQDGHKIVIPYTMSQSPQKIIEWIEKDPYLYNKQFADKFSKIMEE